MYVEAGVMSAPPAEGSRSGVAAECTAERSAVAERHGEAVDRKGIGFAEEAERAYRVGESAAYRSRAVGKEDLPGVSARPGAPAVPDGADIDRHAERDLGRSEEHTSELQSLMRISHPVSCLKKKCPHFKY